MTLRTTSLERLNGGSFDVMIVGGGINGAVAAAVLAGRGASVAIIDRGDFGGFTSQESSNLVWGGFKYLENYEIPLVRGLCKSRNRLIKAYPDNVKSIGFLAALDETSPYSPRLAALGANAYWALGSFQTPRPLALTPTQIGEAEPVIDTIGLAGASSTSTRTSRTMTPDSFLGLSGRRSRRAQPRPITWNFEAANGTATAGTFRWPMSTVAARSFRVTPAS